MPVISHFFLFFFFNDTATTEIYTLSLHDALPIYVRAMFERSAFRFCRRSVRDGNPRKTPWRNLLVVECSGDRMRHAAGDRKSTRLNSSHGYISYAVFCLKKKKEQYTMCLLTVYTP